MEIALSTRFAANHRLTGVWLDRIWDAGFPLVEIFCARQHLDYREPAQIRELGHWFHDSPLQVLSLHAPLFTDDCWGRTGLHATLSITEIVKTRRVQMVDEIKRTLEVAEYIPFRYLIQQVGTPDEEYDARKLDAAFTALEELSVFSRQRNVEILLENTVNGLSTAARLVHLLEITHLRLGFCFDAGAAHLSSSVGSEFDLMKDRVRSTHVHDNDGHSDLHLLPGAEGGTINWQDTMSLFRGQPAAPPLVLELLDAPEEPQPLAAMRASLDRLLTLP